MQPYPPPYAQAKTEENQVLRSLGAILALIGLLLAVLGLIFHQNGAELVFALLIAILSLRVFILWLGDTQHNHHREPFTPPVARNSQALVGPYPPSSGYVLPAPQSTFQSMRTNQMTVPFAPADARGVPPALPPSVRPQTQNGYFSQQGHTVPPGFFAPPTQAFPPPSMSAPIPASYMPGQPMPPAQLPPPSQAPANWSSAPPAYVTGQLMPPSAPLVLPAPDGQPASSGQWAQQPAWEEGRQG